MCRSVVVTVMAIVVSGSIVASTYGQSSPSGKAAANGSGTFTNGTGTFTNGSGTFSNGSGTFTNGSGTFSNGSGTFSNGSGTFTNGSGTLSNGQTFTNGSGTFTNGSGTLTNGSGTLTNGSGTLSNGSGTLTNGSGTFTNGGGDGNGNGVPQQIAALQAQVAQQAAAIADLQAVIAALKLQVTTSASLYTDTAVANEAADRARADATLQKQIDSIHQTAVPQPLLDLAPYLTVDTHTINGLLGPHVILTGVNLHIRNGAPGADPTLMSYTSNGLGNVVIGYNDDYTDPRIQPNRGGSHLLVIGDGHQYTGAGGIVAGRNSFVRARFASVVGGEFNAASGDGATVGGGHANLAQGHLSTVAGGESQTAVGDASIAP